MRVFRQAVAAHFQPFSRELGVAWRVVCPWVEGFSTAAVQVTVGVYHGHSPSLCVKFRPTSPPAPLGTDDENVFGLVWVQTFVSGQTPPRTHEKRLSAEIIAGEVETLAAQFAEFAMPLLTAPNTDWAAIRSFVRERVAASIPEHIKRFTNGRGA